MHRHADMTMLLMYHIGKIWLYISAIFVHRSCYAIVLHSVWKPMLLLHL